MSPEDSTSGLGASEAEARGPVRTLVAEDDKILRGFLEMVVRRVNGIQPSFTDSASEALEILRRAKEEGEPVEIVFSDLGLIDSPSGGFQIADAVRAEGLAAYFILFTGSARDITPQTIEAKGINMLVDKHGADPRTITDALNQGRQAVLHPNPQTS